VYSHNIVTGYSLGRKEVFTYTVRSLREGGWGRRRENEKCYVSKATFNFKSDSLTQSESK
jgi:hypothetical protein